MSDYAVLFAWTFAAVGGALVVGTGAAWLRYRRTGLLPGQQAGEEAVAGAQPARGIAVRLVLGLVLLGWGAATALTLG